MEVVFKKLKPEAIVPTKMTSGSAGFDLYALHKVRIPAHQTTVVCTGIAAEFPKGYYGAVKGRSSMALSEVACHEGTSKYC